MNQAKAKLLYATNPESGKLFLNLQTEDREFWQVEISRDHLAGIIMDGVRFLLSNAENRQ